MSSRNVPRATAISFGWLAALAVTTYVTWAYLRPVNLPPIAFPSGLAVAAVLLSGPAMALGAGAGITLGALALRAPAPMAAAAGAALAVQALLAWAVLRLSFRSRPSFGHIIDAARFFAATLVATLLGTSAGTPLFAGFTSSPLSQALPIGLYLLTSQFLAILLVAPPLLQATRIRRPLRWSPALGETAVSAALMFALGAIVFMGPAQAGSHVRLLPVAVLPLIVWTAVRGPTAFSLALPGLFVLLAVAGTARHVGILGGSQLPSSLSTLQALAGMLGSTCIAIAAIESGRRHALREMAGREAQLQRVLEGSNDGFWEWDVVNGRLHASTRVREILGCDTRALQRYPEDIEALVHPDDLPSKRSAKREHVAGGSSHFSVEYRVRRGDGQWDWVLERGRVSERAADGAPRRISGTLTDIGDRKRAERELAASRELFESFMRNSPSPAYILGADGRVLYLNPALEQLAWGERAPEWRGHARALAADLEPLGRITRGDGRVPGPGGSIVLEQRIDLPRGPVHLLTIRFALQGPEGERLTGGVAMDITERRRAEEERHALEARMTESQRLESLGLLAGGIAHDFNNLLTSILGYADLAAAQLSQGSPAHAEVGQIVVGARRAAELTRRMLAYAGRAPATPRLLSLPAIVEETGQLLQVSIPPNVTVRYDFADELPALRGDDSQLRQVVMNLILNAVEAIGGRPGQIHVRVRGGERTRDQLVSRWSAHAALAGTYVWLEVEDDGCGMTSETRARIFDPFFTTKFTGRGLGLAAVLGIVRAHQGRVQVESEPDVGTSFRVLLPASSATEPEPAPGDTPVPWRAHGRALVIDDEASVRVLARTMLRRIGFDEVLEADGGVAGLERFRAEAGRVDLVLLDLTMPDMDGLQVLRGLLEMRSDAVVVLSSGYAEPDWRGDDATAGVAGFVAKPYRLAELSRQVRAALERAPA